MIRQVNTYLDQHPSSQNLFVWVHLFGPHEPYEAHPEHAWGDREIDRYDSEIAAADVTLGAVVQRMRTRRPDTVVLVSADHGEEFDDHGGRYHGTTVYEEQVRVPLIINTPGLPPGRVVEPVQTVDLLPTVLAALWIPKDPRLRGRDLGGLLTRRPLAGEPAGKGFAFAENQDYALLAQEQFRLICTRSIDACRLFDLHEDPRQLAGEGSRGPSLKQSLRARLEQLDQSHGRFERVQEGTGTWPPAISAGSFGGSSRCGAADGFVGFRAGRVEA